MSDDRGCPFAVSGVGGPSGMRLYGGGECVEVGKADRVLVRDTQDRTGPVLVFSAATWERFAGQVKRLLATGSRRHS